VDRTTRRDFIKASATSVLAAGCASNRFPAIHGKRRPNFLLIICDQLGLDAISAHGCPDVHTPNLDRLVARGVTFMESHSTNPVCSPARSSLMTGRMPVETGVITNTRPIHDNVPDMGQWFRQAGYETVYCGKWHLPEGYPIALDGFDVLPAGQGQGDLVDTVVSRSTEAYLKNRDAKEPFLMVASLLQPHDICYWAIQHRDLVPEEPPFPQLADHLPPLPPNHRVRPPAPKKLDALAYKNFSDLQWRYYIYTYYRQVEMVDADVGRILDALEDSGQADNTIVVLTADHGEGRGRHQHVQKWYPYDESVKVPLIVSCPSRINKNRRDTDHLVCGLDVISTFCDYARVDPPERVLGRSLRPLLEHRPTEWREFLVVETHVVGRTVRTDQFKYVRYKDDPVEQLFDMRADPWETENLYNSAGYGDVVEEHRRLLREWEVRLLPVTPTPELRYRPRPK